MADQVSGDGFVDADRAAVVIRTLRGLRQVRAFEPQPVPETVVDDILTAARWTGSARNRQPWDLVVIRDRTTLQALSTMGTVRFLADAPMAIVLVMKSASNRFDEGRLAERMMLAASAHGVGAGLGSFAPTDDGQPVKVLLGIPGDRFVRTAIGFGYPAPAESSRSGGRREFADFVHLERFSAS